MSDSDFHNTVERIENETSKFLNNGKVLLDGFNAEVEYNPIFGKYTYSEGHGSSLFIKDFVTKEQADVLGKKIEALERAFYKPWTTKS